MALSIGGFPVFCLLLGCHSQVAEASACPASKDDSLVALVQREYTLQKQGSRTPPIAMEYAAAGVYFPPQGGSVLDKGFDCGRQVLDGFVASSDNGKMATSLFQGAATEVTNHFNQSAVDLLSRYAAAKQSLSGHVHMQIETLQTRVHEIGQLARELGTVMESYLDEVPGNFQQMSGNVASMLKTQFEARIRDAVQEATNKIQGALPVLGTVVTNQAHAMTALGQHLETAAASLADSPFTNESAALLLASVSQLAKSADEDEASIKELLQVQQNKSVTDMTNAFQVTQRTLHGIFKPLGNLRMATQLTVSANPKDIAKFDAFIQTTEKLVEAVDLMGGEFGAKATAEFQLLHDIRKTHRGHVAEITDFLLCQQHPKDSGASRSHVFSFVGLLLVTLSSILAA